jgi:hypothetical protein
LRKQFHMSVLGPVIDGMYLLFLFLHGGSQYIGK